MPLSAIAQLYCGGRLLVFSTTVHNNSVILWESVLSVFNTTQQLLSYAVVVSFVGV
jgi:hypothetical protein